MLSVHRPWTAVVMKSPSCPAGSLHASFLCLQGDELPCEGGSDRGAVDAQELVP